MLIIINTRNLLLEDTVNNHSYRGHPPRSQRNSKACPAQRLEARESLSRSWRSAAPSPALDAGDPALPVSAVIAVSRSLLFSCLRPFSHYPFDFPPSSVPHLLLERHRRSVREVLESSVMLAVCATEQDAVAASAAHMNRKHDIMIATEPEYQESLRRGIQHGLYFQRQRQQPHHRNRRKHAAAHYYYRRHARQYRLAQNCSACCHSRDRCRHTRNRGSL